MKKIFLLRTSVMVEIILLTFSALAATKVPLSDISTLHSPKGAVIFGEVTIIKPKTNALVPSFLMPPTGGVRRSTLQKIVYPQRAEELIKVKVRKYPSTITWRELGTKLLTVVMPWKWTKLSNPSKQQREMFAVAGMPPSANRFLGGGGVISSVFSGLVTPPLVVTLTWNSLGFGVEYEVQRSFDLENWGRLAVTRSNFIIVDALNEAEYYRVKTEASGTVTLAWTASPDATVTGYKIYRGLGSGNYDSVDSFGDVTTAVSSDLEAGVTYFFAATAYDASGVESVFSNEISYTPAIAGSVMLQLTVSPGIPTPP